MAVALLCVVAIFLAPQVDLPETGLRAKRAAESLLWVLAVAALFFAAGWSGLPRIARFVWLGGPPQALRITSSQQLASPLLC